MSRLDSIILTIIIIIIMTIIMRIMIIIIINIITITIIIIRERSARPEGKLSWVSALVAALLC